MLHTRTSFRPELPSGWLTMKIRKVRIHRFGGPDVLQVDTVEPSLPDDFQVLVSVREL
jgi:hypothetical protein